MAVHISAHEVADARRQISVHDQPYILTDYIGAAPRRGPVSYTHLTLPTIVSV